MGTAEDGDFLGEIRQVDHAAGVVFIDSHREDVFYKYLLLGD